mmetsp:Transcript_24000/g.66696  ORF Transcript_24000/g.66696 Transcript_24000/m.66696 type:complete len:273 (+) Transcript_24000:40-858(+)
MRGPQWEWRCFFTIPHENPIRADGVNLLRHHKAVQSEPEVRTDVYVVSNGYIGAKLRGGSQLEVKLCMDRKDLSEAYQKVVLAVDGAELSHMVHSIDSALSSWENVVLADGQPASSPKHRCPLFPAEAQVGVAQGTLAMLMKLEKSRLYFMVGGQAVEQTDMCASYAWVPQGGASSPELSSLPWQQHPVQFRSFCVESVDLQMVRAGVKSVMAQISSDNQPESLANEEHCTAWLSSTCEANALRPGCGIFGYPSFVAELAASINNRNNGAEG